MAAFRDLTRQMHDAGIGAARLNAVYIPLVLFASTMAVAIVLLRGGYMVSDHLLELATLSTFTTYAVGIFEPIQMTAANIASGYSGLTNDKYSSAPESKQIIADTIEAVGYGTPDPASAASDMYNQLSSYISAQ